MSSTDQATSGIAMRAFLLQGAYDGKVSRWTEEVVKAKIEGRFSEEERETDKWCLRNVKTEWQQPQCVCSGLRRRDR